MRHRQFPISTRTRLASLALAATVGAAGVFATAEPAAAANGASSCYKFPNNGGFESCINVVGQGRHVASINAGILVFGGYANRKITGHTEITIGGRHAYNSPNRTYHNDGWNGRYFATKSWTPDRFYPDGTRICAKFWGQTWTGWENIGSACVWIDG